MWYHKTDLHRVGKRPDWELVAKSARNPWQRVAAATGGILTPANVTSILGAILVGLGLWNVYNDALLLGFLTITVGRLADVLDGTVAQITGTKSAIGEAIDASVDKLTIIAALIMFILTGIVPLFAAALIAGRNGANIALSLLAKVHKKALHPSRAGKFAGVLEWISLLLFVAATLCAKQGLEIAESMTFVLAYIVLGLTLFLGLIALKEYGTRTLK